MSDPVSKTTIPMPAPLCRLCMGDDPKLRKYKDGTADLICDRCWQPETTRVGPLQRAAQAATKQLATLRSVAIEYERKRRELEIKHARERAALTAWEVECWHYLREGNSDV